jgi:hypothetical protein
MDFTKQKNINYSHFKKSLQICLIKNPLIQNGTLNRLLSRTKQNSHNFSWGVQLVVDGEHES